MPVKVSVIVPVHDTGPDIEGNIDSMLAQTLPPDEYEVIYVDDGSTDDTPERLEKLSVEHPQMRLIRIPASGWPGRPRNVGVANARGEFVQFLDDDDFMAPDALRRLYELGDRSGADIVVGKMASNFSGVPHRAFKRTRESVNVLEDRELMSLTGHKMFRRSFIDEHGLRFHEGKWLGEDLAFVAEAYCRTEKVSFLADYTCYYWWARTQGAHGSGGQRDRRIWFDHIGTIVRTVKEALPAGRPRDMLLGRLYSVEVLAEVQRRVGSDDPEDGYLAWFEQARAMAGELMPASVGPTLEYFERVSALLFERGDAEALAEWTRFRAGVAHEVRFGSAAWANDGALEVGFTARLVHRGDTVRPLRFVREGGRVLLEPESAERFGLPLDILDVTAELDRHRVDLALQHREQRIRWWSRCNAERVEEPLPDGGFAVGFRCAGRLQTEAEHGHGRPGKGLWDAHVGVLGFGVTRGGRFGADRDPGVDWSTGPALLGSPARAVVPYYTNPVGQLTIDVGATAKQVGVYLAGRGPWRLAGARGTAVLGLATARRTAVSRPSVVAVDARGRSFEARARMRPFHGLARLDLPRFDGVEAGAAEVFVRLDHPREPGFHLGRCRIGRDGRVSLPRGMRVWGGEPAVRRLARRIGAVVPASARPRVKRLLKSVQGKG